MLNNATVPVALGKVIVLSPPDASVDVSIISSLSAVEPSNVIFPLASVMELAPSAVPEINVVDAKEVSPAIVEAVAPKETLVPPIVTAELAKLLLAIDDAVDNIVPVSFGKVRVLSPPVASAAVSIVSFASSVDPSNVIFPLPNNMELAPLPATKLVDVKEVNPEIVETVCPKAAPVAPSVIEEFANWLLGIALVPNSPVDAS